MDQKFAVLVAFFVCWYVQCAAGERFFITTSQDNSCPGRLTGDPCLTLRQYISGVHRLYLPNPSLESNITILDIQPGYYGTIGDSFMVQDIDTIVIRGTNATIDCSRRDFRIRYVRYVHISGVAFVRCGRDINIGFVDQLVIENSSFQQRLRVTDTKTALIRKTVFTNGEQILYISDTSITLDQCTFESNKIGIIVEDSNVTVNQSIFRRNSIPSRYFTGVISLVYTGAAIHMSKRFLNQGSMTLTVTNTEFVDNTALNRDARGGAIFLTDGNITVAGCTFMNNTADTYGGAIFLGRVFNAEVRMVEATITQSRFIDNRANNGGGALYASDSVRISQSSFINNTAKLRGGGAVYVTRDNSSIFIAESEFSFNSAAYCGAFDVNGLHHGVKVTDSIFAQNKAGGGSDIDSTLRLRGERGSVGGVICIRSASISVLTSNFSHNYAAGYGGVMYIDDSIVEVRGSVFDNNSAGVDGGVTYTELNRVQFDISHSSFTNNLAGEEGGVIHVRRGGSHVGVRRSSFGNNTAIDDGGVVVIVGGTLDVQETNFYNNTANSGGIITACNSGVAVSDDLLASVDPDHPVCTRYDGLIDAFNTTFVPDETITKPAPNEVTTSTPSDTVVSTTLTGAYSTTTSTLVIDDDAGATTTSSTMATIHVITSPLSVYFELNGSIYLNNSVISLEQLGEGDSALLCKTNMKDCCGVPPNRVGEFRYPNLDLVPIRRSARNFYRNRGDREVRLNRITGSTGPSGRFSCVIPDATGMIQTVYIYLI